MRFDILTLFPEMFSAVLGESIIGRAVSDGLLQVHYTNIRDYANNKHNSVDDYPYGGGAGMVMQVAPIYGAYQSVVEKCDTVPHVIYMSPQGKTFTQKDAVRLSQKEHLLILCGHYEGVDERVLEKIVDEEISMGDYVLTGGEIPAMALVDAVSRMIPGVLSQTVSFEEESHFHGLLEYPQYTRPSEIFGQKVPEVLLSGHHKNIEEWKRKESLRNTYKKRPDLLKQVNLTEKDCKMLEEIRAEEADDDI